MASIWEQAELLKDVAVGWRRSLHSFPEPAWTEFRTAALIIKELERLGYEIHYGDEVIDADYMMGVPGTDALEASMARSVREGADPDTVAKMVGGKTGVVGVLKTGRAGKTVAFRFDMDCNELQENMEPGHLPCREGFASVHDGSMHACGHDGHVAIGLLTAKLLAANTACLSGTVKLIFQPAEEGVRGARAMVEAGVVDDVDFFFSGHIGLKATVNDTLAVLTEGFLATSKLDAEFFGRSAHAGAAPEQGKNALLAAAQAAVSLNTIARHSGGASRINIGVLRAGSDRNIVPDHALLRMETRGADSGINEYILSESRRILKACADMYDVTLRIIMAGSAPTCIADRELGAEVAGLLTQKCGYSKLLESVELGGSEDCTYFMERVQSLGGRALYMMYGAAVTAGHHNSSFDFDEECLWKAAASLTNLALYFTKK